MVRNTIVTVLAAAMFVVLGFPADFAWNFGRTFAGQSRALQALYSLLPLITIAVIIGSGAAWAIRPRGSVVAGTLIAVLTAGTYFLVWPAVGPTSLERALGVVSVASSFIAPFVVMSRSRFWTSPN